MALSPNAGATLWDDAVQSGKMVQPGIPTLLASPEGVIYGRAGLVVTTVTGQLFVKASEADVNTGWVEKADVP